MKRLLELQLSAKALGSTLKQTHPTQYLSLGGGCALGVGKPVSARTQAAGHEAVTGSLPDACRHTDKRSRTHVQLRQQQVSGLLIGCSLT